MSSQVQSAGWVIRYSASRYFRVVQQPTFTSHLRDSDDMGEDGDVEHGAEALML